MRRNSAHWRTRGDASPTLNVQKVVGLLGRCGMSVRAYDIECVTALHGTNGSPAYGASPHDGYGRPLVGRRGRPLILVSSLALKDIETAVVTIFHEIAHHRSYRVVGHCGSEAAAELFGQRKYELFARNQV